MKSSCRPVAWAGRYSVAVRVVLLCVVTLNCPYRFALAQRGGDDPALRDELFQFEPDTPSRLVDAAIAAARLNRPMDARRYLARLNEQGLTVDQFRDLRRQFGASQFLQFNANPDLQPEARVLLMSFNEASRVSAPSDERLQVLVQQLGADVPESADAIVEILSADERAVPVLLAADSQSGSGRIADAVLRRFSRPLRGGLVAALPTATDAQRLRILTMLGETGDAGLIPELLRWQFAADSSPATISAASAAVQRLSGNGVTPDSADSAVRLLMLQVRHELSFADRRFAEQDLPGGVAGVLSLPAREAAVARARRLCADAAVMAPNDVMVKTMCIVSEAAAVPGPPSADDVAGIEAAPDLLVQSLELAMAIPSSSAAAALLQRLSQELTASGTSVPEHANAVVETALNFPDPRVRVLAARLVVQSPALEDRPAVGRTLTAVHGGSQKPEAVVIDVDSGRLNEMSVALEDAGYESVAARTGIQGFEAAVRQLNCELILIHSNCIRWELSSTLANLRADARTRRTPVVIYGPDYSADSAISLASRHRGVWFINEPVGQLTIAERLRYLNVTAPLLTEAERTWLQSIANE